MSLRRRAVSPESTSAEASTSHCFLAPKYPRARTVAPECPRPKRHLNPLTAILFYGFYQSVLKVNHLELIIEFGKTTTKE